ncbi:SAM-dependent methyltransferase [Sphingomonas aracearum]|uniref:Class I SAM-dependent methyltransferase n=1 Tax=Sphingomonas aracearum TaxID=2283317 RepID=A0A369VZE7_9SPHN|nr:cyclopropane-fatty-acyl-phospholipid synthase family protein [Sphingomonas aracearum]RDE05191.1 class I SAM-dependent methyltransferase [Sphingomonas aracearum]
MNEAAPVRSSSPRGADPLRALAPLFHRMLDRIDRGLEAGELEAILPDGRRRMLGGRGEGPLVVVEVVRWRALVRLARSGSVGWYEGWAAGDWTSPDPVPLFDLFMRNGVSLGEVARAKGLARGVQRLLHWSHRNNRAGARDNIHAHYDLGNAFYELWLDAGMTYSSAIFASADEPLEAAQGRKLQAILDRTGAKPGERILEIGCGWGSFAEAAVRSGVAVHGITLSTEQKAYAEARLADAQNASFGLTDYRDVDGQYDAVASIEMVEAVGQAYWPDYLSTIARVLKPGGRAAIQLISIREELFPAYAQGVDFIQRYVFPGGMLLSEARFQAMAAEHGLRWQDREGFGLHYAETLRRWRVSFDRAVEVGALPAGFDARFVALWRYYLMYCEGGFRGGGIDVAQVTLVKD